MANSKKLGIEITARAGRLHINNQARADPKRVENESIYTARLKEVDERQVIAVLSLREDDESESEK